MQKYEYKRGVINVTRFSNLNEMGLEGWRIVSIQPHRDGPDVFNIFLERPIPEPILRDGDIARAINGLRPVRIIKLGVVEFNTPSNINLTNEFFKVVRDLRNSASIVDIWLMDIASTLKKFGYDMTITTENPLPKVDPPVTKFLPTVK